MRSRNIKPGFFENEDIAELEFIERLFFIGLWCYSDREGLFEVREKRLKAVIFPYDNCDIKAMILALEKAGLISTYEVEGCRYGQVINFKKHQKPHPHETKSKLPPPLSLHGEPLVLQGPPMSEHDKSMCPPCKADVMNTLPSKGNQLISIDTSYIEGKIPQCSTTVITEHGEIVPF